MHNIATNSVRHTGTYARRFGGHRELSHEGYGCCDSDMRNGKARKYSRSVMREKQRSETPLFSARSQPSSSIQIANSRIFAKHISRRCRPEDG